MIHGHIKMHLDAARNKQAADYFSALQFIIDAYAEDGNEVPDEEIIEEAAELLFAGHETVASSLTSLVALLAQNQSVVSKARTLLTEEGLLKGDLNSDSGCLDLRQIEDIPYVNYIVEETLRIKPPIGGVFKKALTTIECEVGWLIQIYMYSCNSIHIHSYCDYIM